MTLAAPIVYSQHVTAFAVIFPDRVTVMPAPLAKVTPTMEYQTETVAPAAAAVWPFVNSRALVQMLPAASVMETWVFVFPSVVTRLSVARMMIPRLPASSWAVVVRAGVDAPVHDEEDVLWFAAQKEPTLAKAARASGAAASPAARITSNARTNIPGPF